MAASMRTVLNMAKLLNCGSHTSRILCCHSLFRSFTVPLSTGLQSERYEFQTDTCYPPLQPLLLNTKDPEHVEYQKKLWVDELREKPTIADKLAFISWRPKDKWRELKPKMKDQRAPESWKHCPFLFTIIPINKIVNFLPYQQYISRTHLINGLPELYNSIDVEAHVQNLKPLLEDAILTEKYRCRHKVLEKNLDAAFTCALIDQVVRIAMGSLSAKHNHLQTAKVDNEARQEAFWFKGGSTLTKNDKGGSLLTKFGMAFQYKAKPWSMIRTRNPLPEVFQ